MGLTLEITASADATAAVIDAEFRKVPGLRLTAAQVRRLCNLSSSDCAAALHLLLGRGRLVQDPAGQYAGHESATDGGPVSRAGARRA
jgi:hypothetical protein